MNIQTAIDIAQHFPMLDADNVREYCALPDVMMKQSDLFYAKQFFNAIQHRAPSVGELILLDAFIGLIKESPERFSAVSIRANEAFIAKPLFDLIKLRKNIHPDEHFPITVHKAFETIREAADYKSIREFSMSDRHIFISDSDENAKISAILKGYSPEFCENGVCVAKNTYSAIGKKDIKKKGEYVAVVIYPSEGSAPDAMQSFAKTVSKQKKALSVSVSRGKDVFTNIYSLSKKLTVKAEKLNLLPKENLFEIFSDVADALFTESLFGSTAITVICKKKNVERFQRLARISGLESCAAIEITKTPNFRLYMHRLLLSELRADLFDATRYREFLDVEIPSEQFESVEIPEASKLCEFTNGKDHIYSVTIPLSKGSYQAATGAIISTIISAAYDGYNLKNSCFSLTFSASVNLSDKENTANAFSALAALFNSVTKLGLSIDHTRTSLTCDEPAVSVFLKVAAFGKEATLSTSLTKNSLAKLVFSERPYPDLSIIKDLIEG